MKNKLLIILMTFSFSTFSQIQFENGYFISSNNAKTTCLIRNLGWQNNPTQFEYKTTENAAVVSANIYDIKEFNVGDKYKFIRFKTQIERSSNKIDGMTSERNPVLKEETLFLKVLVEGEINLYEYEDAGLIRYFISSGNHTTAEQLVRVEYLNDNSINENNYYKQQLSVILKSDAMTPSDFKNLKYNKKSLVALIQKYNESKGGKSTNFEIKQNQSKFNLKVLAGANFSSLTLTNDLYISNHVINSNNKPVFVIGLEAEFVLPFNQNKWALFVAPNFHSYSNTTKQENKKDLIVDYKIIDLPMGIRYSFFINNKSSVFLDGGLVVPLDLNSTVSYTTSFGSSELDVKSTSNLFIGVGYRFSNLGIEIRYNSPRELLADYRTWETNYTAIGILLSYKFL